MVTIIEKVTNRINSEGILENAAKILKQGGLVAFPTETVYGLGASAYNPHACEKIFNVKGRPQDNPLIIHINSIKMLHDVCEGVSELAKMLADSFWPGPLTIIMRKSEVIPYSVAGGLDTIGVRIPNNKTALRLIEKCGFPLAAPSANRSGRPSPTRASHVAFDLSGKINMILDGGPCDIGLESTIIDITGNMPVILRPGAISEKVIIETVKGHIANMNIAGYAEYVKTEYDESEPPKAPGMKYRHYSPEADITVIKGADTLVADKINTLISQDEKEGKKAGALVTDEVKHLYNEGHIISVGSAYCLNDIGKNLFKALRKFDFYDIDVVYSVAFDQEGIGEAVMNRLLKAAGGKMIDLMQKEDLWTT